MSPEERAERKKLARAKWCLANADKNAAAKREWKQRNKAALREKAKAATEAKRALRVEKTPEQLEAARQQRLQKKREYQAEYRRLHPERIVATRIKTMAKHSKRRNAEKSAWAKKNAHRVLSWCRQRQLAKIKRTPAWLGEDDLWVIEQAYELAALRTKMFGFQWHVDHKIPLRGKRASGLHVPSNLQVIPGYENSRKSNRMEVA
jgi:hypothetical protein